MIIHIYRFNPEYDTEAHMQSYTIDTHKVPGVMLLHALEYIKTLDASLAFRRSCGAGVCGSDGMLINGRSGLACVTPLKDLPQEVTLHPLPGMPIIRDLVVDLSGFYQQFHSIKPYVCVDKNTPHKEHLVVPEKDKDLDGLTECILCACCSSMCPSYWWNPGKFVGPAGLLWACRFIVDARDTIRQERLKHLDDLYRLYRCRSIMNCVSVCPKGLNPNAAISKIRALMLKGT